MTSWEEKLGLNQYAAPSKAYIADTENTESQCKQS